MMEIALEKNTITHFRALPEQKTVCSMSADAVVPDTQQDILRIINTDMSSRIRSKDVDSGRVVIRGDLDVNVCYLPDGGEGYSLIRLSIPFAADIAVPELDSSCEAVCTMLLQASDVIVLNPRKISVSAGLEISAQCYKPSECQWCQKPSEQTAGLFCKQETEEAFFVKRICEKAFVFEESYLAQRSAKPTQLLSSSHSYTVESCERLSGKLVARIRSTSRLIYSDEQSRLFGESFSSVFSQLFELPELEGKATYDIRIVPSGEYCELSDEKFSVELHAVAQLVCTDSAELEYISDAYSCADELELTYDEIYVAAPAEHTESSDSMRLVYESQQPVKEIAVVKAGTGKLERSDGATTVQVCADVILIDAEDQLRSARVRGLYETEADCSCARVTEQSAVVSGNGIEVQITLTLDCRNEASKSLRYVSAMSAEPCNCTEKRPSIILRRISGGDIWSAAKSYRSDVSAIKKLNGIKDEESFDGKLIMIPKIVR